MLRIGQLDESANSTGRISQHNQSPNPKRLFVPSEDSKKKKKDSKKIFFCYLCTKIN